MCTRSDSITLCVDVDRVYFRPQCLLYYFYVCVLDMPHRARLQPSSICSDVLDHLFLSLRFEISHFLKKGTVTEIFGNCSANGKFRSFVGVQKLMPNHFCQRKARVGDKIAFVGGVADVTSQQMTSFRTLLAIELERKN